MEDGTEKSALVVDEPDAVDDDDEEEDTSMAARIFVLGDDPMESTTAGLMLSSSNLRPACVAQRYLIRDGVGHDSSTARAAGVREFGGPLLVEMKEGGISTP